MLSNFGSVPNEFGWAKIEISHRDFSGLREPRCRLLTGQKTVKIALGRLVALMAVTCLTDSASGTYESCSKVASTLA